jgi:uncharacterized protein DUF1559
MGVVLAFYVGHVRASKEERANSELLPDVQQSREDVRRSQVKNNFKQIGLAMHNFHDTHKHFPAATSTDKKAKQLLSWRVHILTFLNQVPLYQQFHLDEPWDSEHNKTLIKKMPEVYASPYDPELNDQGETRYLVPRGKGTIFDGNGKTEGNVPLGTRIRDIRDGVENTILVLEAAPETAVIWTKPDDLTVDFTNPLKGLNNSRQIGFHMLMSDGTVRFGWEAMNLDTLKALLTRDGGEVNLSW